jgi:outer membrane cobalamin receptor
MKYIFMLLVLLLSLEVNAQLEGAVFGIQQGAKKPINKAELTIREANIRVYTDDQGKFSIILPKQLPVWLVVKAPGFESDSVQLTKEDRFNGMEILLFEANSLEEVTVEFKRDSKSISRLNPILVESLGEEEFKKAACCNLSESFETSATVDVNLTDAISGAKKIQLLGLDGVYTQLQMENVPFLTGIEGAFGMNSVPGTWVESIQITKGTGSVSNGYESLAGLINVEFKKPSSMERLFVNGYTNHLGRGEINVHGGQILSSKWSTGTFVHASGMQFEHDQNKDQFRDLPLSKTLSALNRWEYNGKKFETRFGVNVSMDERLGGQLSRVTNPYRVETRNNHLDVFAKTGFLFPNKKGHSLGVIYQYKYHDLQSVFHQREVRGLEQRAYVNLLYDGIIGSTIHKYKLGASAVGQDLIQSLDSTHMDRSLITPGVFGEYTYTGVRFMVVAGLRADYQKSYGWQVSPRVHAKVTVDEYTDVRITTGKAFRLPNVIIDNMYLLATNKMWSLPASTEQEEVWNSGVSVYRSLRWWKRASSLTVDFYHARFMNQLIADRERNMDTFYFSFQKNAAYSNALQAELSFMPLKTLTVRLAYKWLQVMAEYDGKIQQQVMVPPHRFLLNLAFESRSKRWTADATVSVFGKQRLHDVHLADGTMLMNQKSSVYPYVLAQITHNFKWGAIYLGGENLANFTQKNPIIDADLPFGTNFDATRVWAPILGTVVYAGFRYEIKRKKETK